MRPTWHHCDGMLSGYNSFLTHFSLFTTPILVHIAAFWVGHMVRTQSVRTVYHGNDSHTQICTQHVHVEETQETQYSHSRSPWWKACRYQVKNAGFSFPLLPVQSTFICLCKREDIFWSWHNIYLLHISLSSLYVLKHWACKMVFMYVLCLKTLNIQDVFHVNSVKCVSKIKSILTIVFHAMHGAVCCQLTHSLFDDCENIDISSYHHLQGSFWLWGEPIPRWSQIIKSGLWFTGHLYGKVMKQCCALYVL